MKPESSVHEWRETLHEISSILGGLGVADMFERSL